MGVTLPAGVRAGSTILVLSPRSDGSVDEACLRLLAGDEPRRRNVVALTFDRSAEVFIDAWIDHVGVKPADMSIVDVGADARSVAAGSAAPSASRNVVRSVGDTRDLATIRRHVEELLTEPTASDETRLFYLDSLTAVLREVGLQAALDFLDDVGGLVGRTECVGFVRADRSVHSDHTINVTGTLVDTILEFEEEGGMGSWSIEGGRCAVEGFDESGSTSSIDGLFELLSDRRRRLALHCLSEAEEPLAPLDIATRIAGIEPPGNDSPQNEALERIYTGLVHVHLPKLEAHGVVSVDADGEAIRLGESAERLEPLLAIAVTGDLHG